MADFRVGDCLTTLAYGNGILTRGIQYFQWYMLRHGDPSWRTTHVEVVLAVSESKVVTGSQTFPKAVHVARNKSKLQVEMLGDRPRYALFRFKDYSNIVTPTFGKAMIEWWRDKIGERLPFFKRLWGGLYDVGQLLMYPIGWIRRKLGYKGTVAWLEKTKANVCSDAVASSYRAGLTADGKQEDYIFPGISSSRVAPSHTWQPESKMFRVK
jgi:hypothetical protein